MTFNLETLGNRGMPPATAVAAHVAQYPLRTYNGETGLWLACGAHTPPSDYERTFLQLVVQDDQVMLRNGFSFWQPLAACSWVEQTVFVPVAADGVPTALLEQLGENAGMISVLDRYGHRGAITPELVAAHEAGYPVWRYDTYKGGLWFIYGLFERSFDCPKPTFKQLRVEEGAVLARESWGAWVPLELHDMERHSVTFVPATQNGLPAGLVEHLASLERQQSAVVRPSPMPVSTDPLIQQFCQFFPETSSSYNLPLLGIQAVKAIRMFEPMPTLRNLVQFFANDDYRARILAHPRDPAIALFWRKSFPALPGGQEVFDSIARRFRHLGTDG